MKTTKPCAASFPAAEELSRTADSAGLPAARRRFGILWVIAGIFVWMQSASPGAPAIPKPSPRMDAFKAPPASYKLASNDLIHIKVFGEDELECSSRIARDGTVPFPLLGSVSVGGKTVLEATAAIQSALRSFLVNPQVAVRIMEYNKRRFTVLGQVNRPGTFDMPDDSPLSLLEAIGMAGGYSRLANPSKVTIRRSGAGSPEEIFKVDAKRMAKSRTGPPFFILPGDTVIVEESLF